MNDERLLQLIQDDDTGNWEVRLTADLMAGKALATNG